MPKLLKKIIIENIAVMLTATIFSLVLGVVFASALSRPVGAPPQASAVNAPALINTGTEGQTKQGNLLITGLNTSGAPYSNGLVVLNGNVGIGAVNPAAKVDVSGGVKMLNDTSACNSPIAGTIRFTGTTFQGCDGTNWVPLSSIPPVVCTPAVTLTQTLSCPNGTTGAQITQYKYSTCASGAASPTYGDWTPTTNPNCVTPKVEYMSVKYTFAGATADFSCTPYRSGGSINYIGSYSSKNDAIRATKRSLESCLTNAGTYTKDAYTYHTNLSGAYGYVENSAVCIRTSRTGCTQYATYALTSANYGDYNNFWHQDLYAIRQTDNGVDYILNGIARFVDYKDVVGSTRDYPAEDVHLRTTRCSNTIMPMNSGASRCSVSDVILPTYLTK